MIWLRLGDLQLHLFHADQPGMPQHFGVEVDDFEEFYVRLGELGIRDPAYSSSIYELPSGNVQLYLRDPSGTCSRSTGRTPRRSTSRSSPTCGGSPTTCRSAGASAPTSSPVSQRPVAEQCACQL